jgi:tetratricopeptide (TPR) repeat protein
MCKYLCLSTGAAIAAIAMLVAAGCADSSLAQANATQLQEEQKQIDELQRQLDALKSQQSKFYIISSQIAPGGCDQGVMHDATQRGEQKLVVKDYEAALGYFQDAQSACPNNPQTELNLARVYETMGERDQAVPHYQRAIELAKSFNPVLVRQAKQALTRIGSDPN